jgi:hypothetical protein
MATKGTRPVELNATASSSSQARGSPPPQPGSDCPEEPKLAVSVLAAPTTYSGRVWLHCYSNVAVDVAADI